VSDIEHELIATLWDLKVAKDRIDKLTKSNLQLREGCEALKQRIKRLEEALDTLTLVVGLTPIRGNLAALQEAMDQSRAVLKAKEAKP
jgi:cell division septum initiation protein DivIVA